VERVGAKWSFSGKCIGSALAASSSFGLGFDLPNGMVGDEKSNGPNQSGLDLPGLNLGYGVRMGMREVANPGEEGEKIVEVDRGIY
jgi:hypothetical protein